MSDDEVTAIDAVVPTAEPAAAVPQPALITAVQLGDRNAISRLLSSRADPNDPDSSGDTALHHAVKDPSLVRTLLANQASPNRQNKIGSTPLHKAAMGGNLAVVRMMLEVGADTSIENQHGLRAEHMAKTPKIKELLFGDDIRSVSISVPLEKHGSIIGRKGQSLRQLEHETDTMIQIPARDSGSDVIVIKGRGAGVDRAKAIIEETAGIAKVAADSSSSLVLVLTHTHSLSLSRCSTSNRWNGTPRKKTRAHKSAVFVGRCVGTSI